MVRRKVVELEILGGFEERSFIGAAIVLRRDEFAEVEAGLGQEMVAQWSGKDRRDDGLQEVGAGVGAVEEADAAGNERNILRDEGLRRGQQERATQQDYPRPNQGRCALGLRWVNRSHRD